MQMHVLTRIWKVVEVHKAWLMLETLNLETLPA